MIAEAIALLLAAAPANGCAYDEAKLLALPAKAFDQDLAGGWRDLADRKCPLEAAALLHAYRERNRATLDPSQTASVTWHEGQMRAYAGQSEAAAALLLAGTDPKALYDFKDYALGTAAFLTRDIAGLKAARARLAAQAKPSDWEATSKVRVKAGDVTLVGTVPWPPNLNVLDGLIACFDKPYAEAYAAPCTKSFEMTPEKPAEP